jgi:Fe-S cluster assembly protein SufD
VDGSQHCDNQVIIDHAAPHTTSRELYKGVLDEESRSVFHGSIIVREGAVKVNADQADKNLLLSDKAEADTKPAFWVYCDDVICRHGAACGQIDPAAMFYLQARGIDASEAKQILTKAFLAEITDSVTEPDIRHYMEGLVSDRLSALKANT